MVRRFVIYEKINKELRKADKTFTASNSAYNNISWGLNSSICHIHKPINGAKAMIVDFESSYKRQGSEDFNKTQVILPCSLLNNMSRNSKRFNDVPANVSLLVKIDNITLYTCIFRKGYFYKYATTFNFSLIEYNSMS